MKNLRFFLFVFQSKKLIMTSKKAKISRLKLCRRNTIFLNQIEVCSLLEIKGKDTQKTPKGSI